MSETKRLWREMGSDEEYGRHLRALVESGKLPRVRIELAAALGHRGAVAAKVASCELPEDHRERVKKASAILEVSEAVAFACECAQRVLGSWETARPDDSRPREALQAVTSWLAGDTDDLAPVTSAGEKASRAAIEADYPEFVENLNPDLARAICAANSASHAALAAEYAIRARQEALSSYFLDSVSYAADLAAHAAVQTSAERGWQLSRLAEYILGCS